MRLFSLNISKLPLALLVLTLLILNCVAPTQVRAAQNNNYTISPIDKNTLAVAYANNHYTTKDFVEKTIFKKCAELTIQSGFTFFTLNESKVSSQLVSNNFSSEKAATFTVVKTKNGKVLNEGYTKPAVTIVFPRYTVSTIVNMSNTKLANSQSTYYDAKAAAQGQVSLVGHFSRMDQKTHSTTAKPAVTHTPDSSSSTRVSLLTRKPAQNVIDWTDKSYQHLQTGEWLDAIRTASAAITIDPFYDIPYVNRATAYMQQGYADKAMPDIERVLGLNPDNAAALNIKGYILQNQGNKEQAAQFYLKACQLKHELACQNHEEVAGFRPDNMKNRISYLLKLSLQAFDKKQWDEVINLSNQVLQFDSNNAIAYTNRAGALSEQGHLEQALNDVNQAIKINPDFAVAYNNRGYIYELMGDARSAALEYSMSCKMGLKPSCRELVKINTVANK